VVLSLTLETRWPLKFAAGNFLAGAQDSGSETASGGTCPLRGGELISTRNEAATRSLFCHQEGQTGRKQRTEIIADADEVDDAPWD
jgi:hypothetical protein